MMGIKSVAVGAVVAAAAVGGIVVVGTESVVDHGVQVQLAANPSNVHRITTSHTSHYTRPGGPPSRPRH